MHVHPHSQLHHDHKVLSTPQFGQLHDPINESEFEDFVPISTNMDPNLQFPSSSSYVQLNSSVASSATSSFNSNYFPQSISGNSISSNIHQTPLQLSRKQSTNAMQNLTSTPSQTPVRKSGFVTPRVVGPNGVVFSHKRTKSKVAVEKSPATGNPFYNPPSFLSPKISKKSHRKNVSITNSISLTHLDTDLQIQQMQQLGRSGSPGDTPLRTPGRRSDVQYIYGPDDDNYDDDFDDDGEDDKVGHSHQDDHERGDHRDENDDVLDDGEDSDDDEDDDDLGKRNMMIMKNNALLDPQMLMNSGLSQQSANSTVNDGTFIMPNILMKHKFGDKLVQSSNDLNSVLSGNSLENENDAASLFDNISSANFVNINYLNGMFIPDHSAVESLQQDIFAYPSSTKDTNEAYYGSLGHETPHKQKYQYQKRSVELHQQPSDSSPVLSKASSIPQTGAEPASMDSKIQRSGSSFNLSNIAASREGKNASKNLEHHNMMMSDRYRYHRPDSLMAFQENSPPQTHAQAQAQQQYAMFDPKIGYGPSSHMSSDMMTPVNTAPGSSSVPTTTIPMSTSGTLQQVAESASYRGKELSIPRSSSSKTILESPTMKTRSKSKRTSFALSDIKHPEKLDLPQQSARSRSRSKKTINDEKKIHECPLCHMKFQRPEHVKRHMLSHSSEKPFECPESGCNKRFNRNDNLKQHLRNIHKKQI